MTGSHHAGSPSHPRSQWAPWWLYVGVLLGANCLRAFLMSDTYLPAVAVIAVAVVQAAVLAVVITAIWRIARREAP